MSNAYNRCSPLVIFDGLGMASIRIASSFMKYVIGVVFGLIMFATPEIALADGIFTPFVGMSAGSDQSEKVSTYGVSLAGMAGGIFGFELDYGRTAEATSDSVFIQGSRVTTLNGNVIVGVPIGAVRPYGVGGFGWLRNERVGGPVSSGFKDEGLGFDLGGGIMGFFSDHVGARIDLRYFRAMSVGGSVLDFELKKFSFWRFSAGVALRF